jgi:hypothetical protein
MPRVLMSFYFIEIRAISSTRALRYISFSTEGATDDVFVPFVGARKLKTDSLICWKIAVSS